MALIRVLQAAFAIALLGSTMLLGNLIQTASLVILPFSRSFFREFNCQCAGLWWRLCIFVLEDVYRVRMIYSGDETPSGENVILIANHQSGVDIVALFPLALKNNRLPYLKWFVKEVLKYVPGVGWGMLFLDCVFLRRHWDKDAERVMQTFARLKDSGAPFWLTSFPEGTRKTPEKHKISQKYAAKLKIPIPEYTLVPRAKGFSASVQGMRGRADAVYEVTIGYSPKVPALLDLLRGKVRTIHLHVRRYPLAELPQDEPRLKDWLFCRYAEKDQLLREFYRTGSFTGASG